VLENISDIPLTRTKQLEKAVSEKFGEILEIYRVIIERSCMNNNWEYVCYIPTTYGGPPVAESLAIMAGIPFSAFDSPHLRLIRRIFVPERLDTHYVGEAFNEVKPSKFTGVLDAAFSLTREIDVDKYLIEVGGKEFDVSKFLANTIARSFYDAMSGGMPTAEMIILRQFCSHPSVDLDTRVYPRAEGEEWYTIRDFMEETEKHCSFEFKIDFLSLTGEADG